MAAAAAPNALFYCFCMDDCCARPTVNRLANITYSLPSVVVRVMQPAMKKEKKEEIQAYGAKSRERF